MKKLLPFLALVLLCGCGEDEMEQALALRGRLLGEEMSFRCTVTADYIESLDQFSMDCTAKTDGSVDFTVTAPESIAGISGTASEELRFDGDVLALPLVADDRLSPAAGPWLLMKALRSGYITSVGREGEGLVLTIDDSYADDALTLHIRTDGAGLPVFGEVFWKDRRVLSMEVEFSPSGA